MIRVARARNWRFNPQKLRKIISQVHSDLQNTQKEVGAEVGEFMQSPHLLFQPIRMYITLTLPMFVPLLFMPSKVLFMYLALISVWYLTCLLLFATEVAMRPPWYKKGLPTKALPPYWSGYVRDPKVNLAHDFQNVEFMSSSGSKLRGWFVPTKCDIPSRSRHMIVFVHGVGRDRRAFLRHSECFLLKGYSCLLFDLSEHGLSESLSSPVPRGTLFGAREQYDVIAAAQFLKTVKGATSVAVVGTSCGASSAILAAALEPEMAVCVVAENPFTRADTLLVHHLGVLSKNYLSQNSHQTVRRAIFWLAGKMLMLRMGNYFHSFGPIDAVRHLKCPILVAHSTTDDIVPFQHGLEIYNAALESQTSDNQASVFVEYEDAAHCALFDKDPDLWSSSVIPFIDEAFVRSVSEENNCSSAS